MTRARILAAAAAMGLAGACQADLVNRYSFNDGTANDYVGGANGLLVNGATVTGGQLVFDPAVNNGTNTNPATGQYVDLPDTIGRSRAITLEAWTTFRGAGPWWQRIADFGNSTAGELLPTDKTTIDYTGTDYIALSVTNGGGHAIGEAIGPTDERVQDNAALQVGVEHHIVFTRDPDVGIVALYVDGRLVSQGRASGDPAPATYLNHFLGRSNWYHDGFYNGTINEFRIYDSYLTAQTVLLDYQNGPGPAPGPDVSSVWQGNSGTSWGTAAAWNQGVPNSGGSTASFTGGAGSIAKVDGTITIGALNFSGPRSYDIQPGTGVPNLLFAGPAAQATIDLSTDAAPQTISAPVLLGRALTVTSNVNGLTMSGGISGNGGGIALTAGTLVLAGVNTYSLNTNVTGGILRMGSVNAAAASSTVVLSPGAMFDLNSNSQVIGGLSGTGGTVTSNGPAVLTVNQPSDTAYSGIISGAGVSVIKSGAGALTLTGASAYGGGTSLSGGKLVLSNSSGSALGSGDLVVNGGILASGSSGALSGSVLAGSGAHTISPGDQRAVGVLRTGSLYLTSNTTLDFSDVISPTSMDQIVSSGSLNFSGGGATTIVVSPFLNAGTYRLIDFASAGTAAVSSFSMPGAPARYALQLDATNHDLNLIVATDLPPYNWIGASGAMWTNAGNWSSAVTPTGPGASATFTGNGGATVSVNGTVTVGSLAFSGSKSYNIAGGTSPTMAFDSPVNTASILLSSGAAAQFISTPVTLISDLTVTNNSGNGLTFSGGISGTDKGISLTAGLLVLQGTGTYTGNTTITGGALRIGSESAIGPGSTVILSPGTTLDLNSNYQVIGGLSGTGGTVTSAGAAMLTVNQSGSTTFSGRLSGALEWAKTGTGTLTLANTGTASDYTGWTQVVGGTLRNGAANQIPDGAIVLLGPAGTWDLNGYAERISDFTAYGTGTVNLNGGTLELTNASGTDPGGHHNNIAGAGTLILSGGVLATGNTTHWDMTGAITITNGAELIAGHGDATSTIHASDVYVTNGKLALMDADNRLIPTVRIHMSSAGTLLMKQDQGWTDAGVSQTVAVLDGTGGTVNNNDTTAAHTLTVNPQSGTSVFGGLLTNGNYPLNIVKSGAGTWVLTGRNTYTGSTTVTGGTLVLRNTPGSGTGTGPITVSNGATLSLQNGGKASPKSLTIDGSQSAVCLGVTGSNILRVGDAATNASIVNNGVIECYADAFLAAGTYTPITAYPNKSMTWSGTGTFKAFGGTWDPNLHTFTVVAPTTLAAGLADPTVAPGERYMITDLARGKRIAAAFGSVAANTNFRADWMTEPELASLATMNPTGSVLSAWDFTTNFTGGEVLLSMDIGQWAQDPQVWHLHNGAWSLYTDGTPIYDGNGFLSFTATEFSGYAVTAAVPEPSVLSLLAAGALGFLRRRRRA